MNQSIWKPYDAGHGALMMGNPIDRRASLEMEGEGDLQERMQMVAPLYLTLRLELQVQPYGPSVTLERVVNGISAGITPLYSPGRVLRDGSDNLKPLCKARSVDFVYQGKGFYWDEEEVQRPFSTDHSVTSMIQLSPGQTVFQKPFAGCDTPLRLETQFKHHDRDEWTDVVGHGRETYPLYPYGGYAPLYGDLREMEQVYAFAGVDRSGGTSVTALKLYRSSFFHTSGGFPPVPFSYDHKTWVFPQKVSTLEHMTVGQAICEGHLMFTLKDGMGGSYTYTSYAYEHVGGMMTQVHVLCHRRS